MRTHRDINVYRVYATTHYAVSVIWMKWNRQKVLYIICANVLLYALETLSKQQRTATATSVEQ